MVERLLFENIIKSLSVFPVTGIIGPRQVGKTTLTKHVISKIMKESVYLDLESPLDQNKLSDPELYLNNHTNECIVLDEIQRIPDLFPVLRSIIDKDVKPGRFIILGSASPKLIRDSSETLAGRIVYNELTPFNLLEIENSHNIIMHWFLGGFPNSLLKQEISDSILWLDAFIMTYIERDLPILGLNVSSSILRRFWIMLAHWHGNILNSSNLSKSLGVSSPTVNRYIDFLENAFIINKLYPFSINIKKRLVKSPKIYIRDSGILHRLLSIKSFEDLQSNPIIGSSFEGYVIEQIRQVLSKDLDMYFYRTHNGCECDLVIVKSNKVIATAEIKYSSSPKLSKGYMSSIEDLKCTNNFIIIYDEVEYPIRKDIIVCGVKVFLKKFIDKINT
jgi:uncharacterized protein